MGENTQKKKKTTERNINLKDGKKPHYYLEGKDHLTVPFFVSFCCVTFVKVFKTKQTNKKKDTNLKKMFMG